MSPLSRRRELKSLILALFFRDNFRDYAEGMGRSFILFDNAHRFGSFPAKIFTGIQTTDPTSLIPPRTIDQNSASSAQGHTRTSAGRTGTHF